MSRELVLCVGMHRSGTSLTASLLQAIGLPLPGNLIAADVANPSGYFENRSVVEAQEQLLRDLGVWWPSEAASHGLPEVLQQTPAYRAHVEWLTTYLAEIFRGQNSQLAIKDPRTSLLLPAWREAADRLGIQLKLVICLRQPRDVCWSLVWLDGPSVGMGWGRAQRLWLEHYRALLVQGRDLPAQVAVYEAWLQPELAQSQLQRLAAFLQLNPSAAEISTALERVQPEFNHGGGAQLPAVARSLRRLHSVLARPGAAPRRWKGVAERAAAGLRRRQRWDATRLNLQLLWLRTPWGLGLLGPAFDPQWVKAQLGHSSLRHYRRQFSRQADLRPHPLISPEHLNRERNRCGLPPLRSADELFRHLLDPDLIPLNPHPWFDSRGYQQRSGSLGAAGVHPVLTYLRRARHGQPTPEPDPAWLQSLGAGRPTAELEPLPPLVQQLRPGLVLADPLASLGDPSEGQPRVIRAHEAYWQAIQNAFAVWPGTDRLGPLRWLQEQAGLEQLGCASAPARGLACWWLPGDWPAPLLAELAGADLAQSRAFSHPTALIEALPSERAHEPPILLAITPAVLAQLLDQNSRLPAGTAVLNLAWPEPGQQSAWLHLLAGAERILECRPAVRAYLQGLGLRALWCDPPAPMLLESTAERQLLLGLTSSGAEAQLARQAERLDPGRYSACLRLDAQMLSLGDAAEAPGLWLTQMQRRHGRWLWLSGMPEPDDVRAWALFAWARQRRLPLHLVGEADPGWLDGLYRPEATAS
jgi:hypothetical protein